MKGKEEFQYNGFRYIKDYSSSLPGVYIDHNHIRPEFLYKFFSFSAYSVDALIANYLYASHPFELNDFLDSSRFLWITKRPIEFERYEAFFSPILSNDEVKDLYEKDSTQEARCEKFISNVYKVSTNLFGVISTTATENSLLMWPHYTQEKGFQLKFRTNRLEGSIKQKLFVGEEYLGLFPMNYSDKIRPIDISPFKELLVPLFYSATLKSDQWLYEDEWRFIVGKRNMGIPFSKAGMALEKDYFVQQENRFVYYAKEIIEEICLGMNFFNVTDFSIEIISEEEFVVNPITEASQSESRQLLLDYIVENLSDKLFYSGVKYELDDDYELYLIRTKEQLLISKQENNTFAFKRTNNIIKVV